MIDMRTRKNVKIDEWAYDRLDLVRAHIQAKTESNVSLSTAIDIACGWRDAIAIDQDGGKLYFSICYIESDKGMMPQEVMDYQIMDYTNEKRLADMIDPARVVIPDEKIRILYEYPLSHTVEKIHEKKGGFTRMDLFKLIGADYAEIYKEEEASMTIIKKVEIARTENVSTQDVERELLSRCGNFTNRGLSDGKHGIWGHVLKDLALEGLVYDTKTGVLDLQIGS